MATTPKPLPHSQKSPAGREVAFGDRREDAVDGVEVAGHESHDGIVEPALDELLEPTLRLADELPHPVGHPDRDLPEIDVYQGHRLTIGGGGLTMRT